MARTARTAQLSSRTLVTALVAAALIAVGVLAEEASGTAPSPAAVAARTNQKSRPAGGAARGPAQQGLPLHSGSGERVVYSLRRHRVWLVDDEEQVVRTFTVVGGTVEPALGSHRVFARRSKGRGGDGAAVEHVVLFAETDGKNIGFSAAADGSLDRPDPAKRTTAVRTTRADADAVWVQATIGTTVEVVK
ncbi:L,D-transpeptidase [Streptomyces sp. NBC_01476]|uniref:L,D-transpeptidase n=1 Tax=Streptomyces sp. NBC_01476 TaxID=2903881 RepID=UPI002E3629C0|nr:L,D-transpeptidase [Streptomyces sp. NBC_01476]